MKRTLRRDERVSAASLRPSGHTRRLSPFFLSIRSCSQRFVGGATLAAIPVVSPAQYGAITCNRRGVCCEDIRGTEAPYHVAALAAGAEPNEDRRRFLSGLEPVGPTAGGWRYRCRHFGRDAEGLGVCGVWATRPSVCSGFPYNRVVRTWRECTWYVQVRDAEGRVIEVVDAAADGSGPAPPVAADLAVLTMGELAELNQANQGGDA